MEPIHLLSLVILLVAVILHEVAHGYAAFLLGDHTARHEGRLTLNPIPHIDLLGTIIVPGILILTGSSILFGWAKPVPYNPYNLRGRYGETIVAAAGSATNFAIAIVFGLLYRFGDGILPEPLLLLCILIVFVNLFLGLLNLIPIPPLDGSKIVLSLLPVDVRMRLEQRLPALMSGQSLVVLILTLLVLSWFVFDYIVILVSTITVFLTGGIPFF